VLQNYQQTLDFVVGEDEHVFFKVTGTHTVHLTGNYVIPTDDGQARLYGDEEDEEDEDDEYDLSPDEDELEALEEDVSDDELDDLADPRVMEVDTDEGEPPKLVAPATGKGKNKRPAPASDDEEGDEEANLDDIMAKSLKAEEPKVATKEEPRKLTKAEKKKLKKLKKNDGEAAPASMASTDSKTAEQKEAATTNGDKKVQFAKNLEQGPTPSATKSDKRSEPKGTDGNATLSVKEVQGVIIDDRKLGTGPAAKKGNKVEMRYIGKLENGKVFDGKQKPEEALSI
jgi:FK506-binding nuclear protein